MSEIDYYTRKGKRLDKVLYLDYDGVLHPDEVYQQYGGSIVLRCEGELFMFADALIDALRRYPDVRIILSTSWVRVLNFEYARGRLPDALMERVDGATWHSGMCGEIGAPRSVRTDPFNHMSRFHQIRTHAARHGINRWIAIDDLHSGDETWPDEHRSKLVLTDQRLGLGCPQAQADLLKKLEEMGA